MGCAGATCVLKQSWYHQKPCCYFSDQKLIFCDTLFVFFAEHVKEYLDLSSKAANDENKARNIKIVFEKQNAVSAQSISKLQVSQK